MTYNPFKDAKFLVLLLDALISLTVFFVGKYAPVALEDVKLVIGVIQPIFLALFVGFLQRDNAVIAAGNRLGFLSSKK